MFIFFLRGYDISAETGVGDYRIERAPNSQGDGSITLVSENAELFFVGRLLSIDRIRHSIKENTERDRSYALW